MHSGNLIHGDLTTSNMMLRLPEDPMSNFIELGCDPTKPNKVPAADIVKQMVDANSIGELYLIDFGLSQVSPKVEDKGVDFYVLKRAFISTHPGSEALFDRVLTNYEQKADKGAQILAKFRDVEKRGRKRECFG